MIPLITTCVAVLSGAISQAQGLPDHVPLLRLLANPEQYDGKDIQLIGFLHLEFEGNALYLHKEDFDHGLGNDIWIDVTQEMRASVKEINDKYVIIRGV